LLGLARRWQQAGQPDPLGRRVEADPYLKEFPDYKAVGWLDAQEQVRWSLKLDLKGELPPVRSVQDHRLHDALRAASESGNAVLAHVIAPDGERHLIAYVPIHPVGHSVGFVFGVYRADILRRIVEDHLGLGYAIAVFEENEELFRSEPATEKPWPFWEETAFDLYGIWWRVQVWPRPELLGQTISQLPRVVLVAGLLLSTLLALAVHFAQTAGQRARELSGMFQQLGKEMNVRKQAEKTLRQLTGWLLQTQDHERRRLARELHDSAGQALVSLALNLSQLRESARSDPSSRKQMLAESLSLVEQCAREIRSVCYLLHPPVLDELGLPSAIRSYAEGVAQRTGIRIELGLPEDLGRLPAEIETTVYRLIQEGLTNVARHSHSPVARIRLERDPVELRVEIQDEGKGIPDEVWNRPDLGSVSVGLGITVMRERIRQMCGRLEIQSSPQGTTIRAFLPIAPQPVSAGAARKPSLYG
jgi:signal transduction histidine kinase